jgi:hypothetical protein
MDLLHFIKTTINPEIAAQMAQSIAWRADVILQAQARALLKELTPALREQGIEEYNELEASIASAVIGEYSSTMAGRSAHGPIRNIKDLTLFRCEAHQLAKTLTGLTFDKDGCGKHYEVPDLEEVFFAPIDLKVNQSSRRAAIRNAERTAAAYELTTEETQKMVENKLKRKEQKAKDTSRFLMDQQGTIATLYRLALRADVDYKESESFDEMSKPVQLALITAARDSALRYAEWSEDYGWLSDNEKDDIGACSIDVAKKLRNHIQSLTRAVENA